MGRKANKAKRSRKRWLCAGCGEDTSLMKEHYFLNTELWLQVNNGQERGMLCIGCVEKRLGRKLNTFDFPSVHINNPKLNSMSTRLHNRIHRFAGML